MILSQQLKFQNGSANTGARLDPDRIVPKHGVLIILAIQGVLNLAHYFIAYFQTHNFLMLQNLLK